MSRLGRIGSPERRLAERKAVIDAHLEVAVAALRARVESGWINESESPLGRASHVEATARRMARHARLGGAIDAIIDGDGQHCLTVDAVADEVYRGPRAARSRRRAAAVLSVGPSNDNAHARGRR
jgi:hypothetical protein